MKDIYKKISYVHGLADGIKIEDKGDEGKILSKILEILDELADAVDDVIYEQEEQDTRLTDIEDDLECFEQDLYGDEDDDDDEDDDEDDEDNIFGSYDEDSDSEFFEIECPNCGEDVMIDFDTIDEENGIICPHCHEEIVLEFDCDDDCDCHNGEDEE